MEAILYAAGVGRRLEDASAGRPKVLLEIGGKSLLEWHLIRLAGVGLRRLTVVTGYEHLALEESLRTLETRYPVTVTTCHNPRFTEGSALSFAASIQVLNHARNAALLMDADVLYPEAMLRRLVDSRHGTVLLADRDYSTADDDPVLVPVVKGRPVDFVKRWNGTADWVGESVGFFKVAAEDLGLAIDLTRQMSTDTPCAASYDDVLRELVRAGRFAVEDVTGLPWTEIDFPQDVERARLEVLPSIEALERNQAG